MSRKEGIDRWLDRLANFIPNIATLAKAIGKSLVTIMEKVQDFFGSFSSYLPKTPMSSSMLEYPGYDMPLVIKIESYKNRHHFHGASQYGDVFVESDGDINTTDQENFVTPIEGMTEPMFFIMSPKKLGLDPNVLKQSMMEESAKVGDYDFYADNCIDHVLRPIQKAGANVDFGRVSTPKELAMWCDEQCQQGNGILVDMTTYKRILAGQNSRKNNSDQKVASTNIRDNSMFKDNKHDADRSDRTLDGILSHGKKHETQNIGAIFGKSKIATTLVDAKRSKVHKPMIRTNSSGGRNAA